MNNYLHDIDRIESLLSYAIIDSEEDDFFNSLTNLVATICETPTAFIAFHDGKRQWHKAKVNLEAKEYRMEDTICQYTLLESDLLEIPNTLEDHRFDNNPLVQTKGGIRFYAGVPLKADDGHTIGTVCTIDYEKNNLTETQREALRNIAELIMLHLNEKKKKNFLSLELQHFLDEKERQAQRRQDLQEQAYNNLFEAISLSNAVAEFDTNGTILNVNDKFARIFGYSAEQMIGKSHRMVLTDKDLSNYDNFWKKLASGKPHVGKFKRKHKNKSDVWIQASYCPVPGPDGKIHQITKICLDVTRDVMAKMDLENLSRQKDNFIANISHELRTPIHSIIGYSDLLLENEYEEIKSQQLQTIKTSGETLLHLVNGILDLSKIEAGLFQFDHADFDIRSLIESVFSILNIKAINKSISFSYTIDEKIPKFLTGDKTRLSQILINLLDNAIKFTLDGEVKLEVSLVNQNDDKINLNFKVSDTGIGIKEDKIDHIFERFTQAEGDTTRNFGGSGLGLNICKLLVEKQGGVIKVKSKIEEGTEFNFFLTFEVPVQQKESSNKYAEIDYSELKGNILMCEDNEMNRDFIRFLVANTKINIDFAENGKKGIELFEQKKYDVVLMDIQMPVMDGFQTTKQLRQVLKSTVPIVAITANSMVIEKIKCITIGMNDYLSKPFKKDEFFEKISYWLNLKQTPLGIKFSTSYLAESSGGDKTFEVQMLNLLLSNTDTSIQQIKRAFAENKIEEIPHEAHKLKSVFGIYGMDQTFLHQLEFKTGNSELPIYIYHLEKQILQTQNHVKNLLEKNYEYRPS